MFNTTEKRERALGVKLFLKPERCMSEKCVIVRRPTRPGAHGKARRQTLSEFGQLLQEKQRFKHLYGVREAYLRRIFSIAVRHTGVTGDLFASLLERRLDNVVFRLGFAPSRSVARQLVGHGHFLIKGRRVTIPSYQVKAGDVIRIRPESQAHPRFKELAARLKTYDPPAWLRVDVSSLEGHVLSDPKDLDATFNANMVVDFYSRSIKK